MASETKPVGVYRNKRLMHACTTIIGFTVHLQTKDGSVWEGIFNTFSPEFTICLDLAIQIDPKTNPKDCLCAALKAGKQAEKQAFFDLKDIVHITVLDVDLNYASVDLAKLTIDADISGFDANKLATGAEHRQLESWQDDDDGDTGNTDSLLSLDDVALSGNNKSDSQNNSRGWDPQEMFNYNERVHKVTTTYDEKLSDYTLPLPKHSSKEWRKKQERAAAIAKEIEGNTKSQGRLAKEDEGDCEEEKFSAVIRPTPAPPAAPRQPPPPPPTANTNTNANASTNTTINTTTSPANSNVCHNKNFRPRPFDRDRSRIDSLKNFGNKLSLGPMARQQQSQNHSPQVQQGPPNNLNQQSSMSHQQPQQTQKQQPSHQHQQQHQNQHKPQQQQPQNQQHQLQQQQQHQQPQQKQPQVQPQHQPAQQAPHTPSTTTITAPANSNQSQQSISTPNQQTRPQTQAQVSVTTASPASTVATTTVNTSTLSERSDTSSSGSKAKDHQSELARKSTLNPNAKEFVYKPRSPATNQGSQTNGANQASGVASTMDPSNSSAMSQTPHAGNYYQQIPMFPHGLSPHQQPHHAAQFMPNHAHPHFQNQIHYMSPVPPHFAQQMSPRYIRSNFQNYHHRGDNVRADYSQASMMVPTSSGQPFVSSQPGAPHPMNAYAASPQQPMIYSGPPQSMYSVVQAGFPQHMPHMMPNPPPYDGSTVYMPSQNYIVNP